MSILQGPSTNRSLIGSSTSMTCLPRTLASTPLATTYGSIVLRTTTGTTIGSTPTPPLDLLNGQSETFARFLTELLHPIVRADSDEARELAREINDILSVDELALNEDRIDR